MKRSRLWITAALSVGLAAPAGADNVRGTCQPAKVKFIADDSPHATTSTSFVNIPGASINFTQGGASASCVVVYFSGDGRSDATNSMLLRATLDGIAGIPAFRYFIFKTSVYETRTASFVFPSVAPGIHTLRMQYSTSLSGTSVAFNSSNLTLHYAP